MRVLIPILLATLGLASAPAHGKDPAFIVRVLPSGRDIAIAGPFIPGLAAAFEAALAKAPQARLVRLESDGGRFDVALDIYRAIRLRGLETAVQGRCLSACTIAFMAGQRRHAAPAARLGFHTAASPEQAAFPMVDYMIRGFYVHSGMAEPFADRVMATPHNQMWLPSLRELRRANVITDIGIPP